VGIGVLVAVVAAACHGPDLSETREGPATFLNGREARVESLDVSEALRLPSPVRAYVRGYVYAPFDERPRLCARLESGGCRGASLDLDAWAATFDNAAALEVGCCATGYWSVHPVVLHLAIRGRKAELLS
jgi:hypothetical protein